MGYEFKASPDVADWKQPLEGHFPVQFFKSIVLAASLGLAAMTAGSATRDIYPDPAQAKSDLAWGLKTAAQSHKRLIVDFGGNWCGDCQVLDFYFHNPENRPILESNFVLVHINIGRMDENLEIAEQYGIPVTLGVPALAVLSEKGKLLYGQRSGEFKSMRRMDSSSVTRFLVQWKPAKAGCSVMVVNC
jgi:thioredoxin 1